jgi:hypothetical protein
MKIIFTSFDKAAITNLPRALFPGKIVVVDKPEDTEAAVNDLLSHYILGVDTETRPSFKRGQAYHVSLLQVSTHDTCYLFRLHHTGMTPAIIRLLEDTTVPKVGLSWHDDLLQLHKRAAFKAGYFIELQDVAKNFGIADMSLQKLYANLFHQKISKAQRLSNWEARIAAEKGACEDKFRIAKLAKEQGSDAIHDTVHEMAKDEARHCAGFAGLYKRYFK